MVEFSEARARSFSRAAQRYGAHRPAYPAALFDAVETLAGRPLRGARTADVGAGTGLATAGLRDRGARVVAVEPGDGMAAEFRRRLPDVPLVRGDGNRLPLATASLDLVTYAQSFHWTDPARSVPEAARVLRPGGALALFWNEPDVAVPWIAEQDARIRDRFGEGWYTADHRVRGTGAEGPAARFTDRTLHWSRRVPLDVHLAKLSTHSLFLTAGAAGEEFLAAERALLTARFPSGEVEEHYAVELRLAVMPPSSRRPR
ncbi:class I SAM-dependent methyltransferase [Streptomyces sp. NPDC012888]|uniref:class I SAM-dependent methyltransferase n=1 Tax=Streptomyces sp. NPDC012888 TaxID=3364855 RepID=UPI00368070DE